MGDDYDGCPRSFVLSFRGNVSFRREVSFRRGVIFQGVLNFAGVLNFTGDGHLADGESQEIRPGEIRPPPLTGKVAVRDAGELLTSRVWLYSRKT